LAALQGGQIVLDNPEELFGDSAFMKIRLQSILVITLLFPGVLTQMQAVSPTPDGCYPNFTTAEGCDALSLLTTGAGNTALGWRSLFLDTTGSFNTAVGGGALALNTADDNTAVGTAALLLNTTGSDNTAVGTDALLYNDSGTNNTAIGSFALFNNTTGNLNTANGLSALLNNTTGLGNTAVGGDALVSNTTGANNTAIGASALSQNTVGNNNIALGGFAGTQITGDNNIDIGNGGEAAESDAIRIGSNFLHTATYIAGISGQAAVGGDAVLITDDGKLGTITVSSERFKEDIKPMDQASETILALNPVTFRYKSEIDPKGIPQFGLVAEEVDKVSPDLVKRDAKGEIYTVRYDAVNAMLLNEFLKEHRAFVEEQRKVANQQKEIEALKVGLKEQRSIIENVSARLEASQPATEVAAREP
jgi:Chaperone of endosialidase